MTILFLYRFKIFDVAHTVLKYTTPVVVKYAFQNLKCFF